MCDIRVSVFTADLICPSPTSSYHDWCCFENEARDKHSRSTWDQRVVLIIKFDVLKSSVKDLIVSDTVTLYSCFCYDIQGKCRNGAKMELVTKIETEKSGGTTKSMWISTVRHHDLAEFPSQYEFDQIWWFYEHCERASWMADIFFIHEVTRIIHKFPKLAFIIHKRRFLSIQRTKYS
jgi:hypothetical protein